MDHTPKTNVFITGVSSGIGYGLAEWYLAQGRQVFGLSRRTPPSMIDHPSFHFESLDLRDEDQIAEKISKLLEGIERVDLVVLNAGILGEFGDLQAATLEDVKQTMHVNVWANKLVLDRLYDLQLIMPQVVAISSGAAVNGNRGWSGYSVSKAALNMLIKLYARERPESHFCALAPGLVDTAMQDQLCGQPPDERYPALETLRSKRNTPDMPHPDVAAEILAHAIDQLPTLVDSGDFTDVRHLPGAA